MRFLAVLIGVLAFSVASYADDKKVNVLGEDLFRNWLVSLDATNCECKCDDCTGQPGCECCEDCTCGNVGQSGGFSDRDAIADLQSRVLELERTAIDADEARQIATEVVEKYVSELRVAINTPGGGQRTKTVKFSDGSTVEIALKPGETLSSCSDPSTGQVYQFGSSVPVNVPGVPAVVQSWSTQAVEVRSVAAPSSEPRRFFLRPRQQTCRMVNGVRVCN